jgi:predicted dehydrogenase
VETVRSRPSAPPAAWQQSRAESRVVTTVQERSLPDHEASQESPVVRIGIVGCGSVCRAYSLQIDRLRTAGLVEVVAACDVDAAREQIVSPHLGRPRFTTDYRQIVESDDVDLVLILTSMPEHGAIAVAALESGKHVLVEKPLATTLEEAEVVLEAARRAPGYFIAAPHVILSPTYQILWKRVVVRNDIGKVLLARGRYGWSGPWWGQWFYRRGGGCLFDLAVYNITSLTGLLGPVKRVTAMTGVAVPERVVDGEPMKVEASDNAQILLDFGENVFASVTSGFTMAQYRSPALELYGTEGTIQLLGDDWAPEGYELWRRESAAWELYPEADRSWHWTDGLRHLVDCARRGSEPLSRPEHALHVLEVMLKAEKASSTGQTQVVESTFAPIEFNADEIDVEPEKPGHDRRSGW